MYTGRASVFLKGHIQYPDTSKNRHTHIVYIYWISGVAIRDSSSIIQMRNWKLEIKKVLVSFLKYLCIQICTREYYYYISVYMST